ncbi:CobW family GTP-binding protein [Shewanella sp. 0m-4]
MIQKIIPTNVITGFLGVGKTSFIKNLLQHKPKGEVWAVLVNEFGEIGIDAGLLDNGNEQVQIKEVAGGCMCCAAGLPMQVAINQLIAKAKPDRLLIEPTGLGHPKEVLKVLTQPHYQHVLAMKACVTLVDARKLNDSRYTEHEIFNQQLQVADVVIASKTDCYPVTLIDSLIDYLAVINGSLINSPVIRGSNEEGQTTSSLPVIPWSLKQADESHASIMSLLEGAHQNKSAATEQALKSQEALQALSPEVSATQAPRLMDIHYSPLFSEAATKQRVEFNDRGLLCMSNQGEGFYSCGWVFDPSYEFDFDRLLALISNLQVARIKAVMITEEGIAGFNGVDGELSIVELDDAMDSRIELLSMSAIGAADLEKALLGAATRLNG